MKQVLPKKLKRFHPFLRSVFWFSLGGVLGLFFFASFLFIYYRNTYADTIYPGISVGHIDFSGKKKADVIAYFGARNHRLAGTSFQFVHDGKIATVSARSLHIGYDTALMADQAYSTGRSIDFFANLHLIFQAYFHGLDFPVAYTMDQQKLQAVVNPINKAVYRKPVNAVFSVKNGKVTTFKPSLNGQEVDTGTLQAEIANRIPTLLSSQPPKIITMRLPIHTTLPQVTTDNVNNYGIKELVAEGTSHYAGSIPNRIYNIKLAANRINGTLIPPDSVFSFDKTVGDVSALTGYKQAYVIQNGHTVLGDGGGLCQVSTTMFRAALNAGVPILERNQHAYRVHYYEEDMGPGYDAAVYTPTVDFKFKNDTGHYLLIKTVFDDANQALSFQLYGTKDSRTVTIGKPVILSTAPAPDPLYQDDPTLPKGQIKQVDFAAPGMNVYFKREVKKDGKVIIADTFTSHYRPWQAVYMRGTQ